MQEHRHQRFISILNKGLNEFLLEELPANPGTVITISYLEVTEKETVVKAHISVFPVESREGVEESLKTLENKAGGYLRKNLRLRNVPIIKFVPDRGEDKRERIEELLKL